MGQDKKQLIKLLAFVKALYDNTDNKEFVVGINSIVLNHLAITTNQEIERIKEVLELRADSSIDYSFVRDVFVRRQLIIDNLRMENVLLNLSMPEKDRYDNFCVNAFLQVENILNYFYCAKFGKDMDAILDDIEDATQFDRFPFKRSPGKRYYSVSEIAIATKIQAFCDLYLPINPNKDYTSSNLHRLRNIRNEIFHRAGENDDSSKGTSGSQATTPVPTVAIFRDALRRLVLEVKQQLQYFTNSI